MIYEEIFYGNKSNQNYFIIDPQSEITVKEKELLIYFHGGGWVIGDAVDENNRFVVEHIAKDNQIIVSVNYSLFDYYNQITQQDILQDGIDAFNHIITTLNEKGIMYSGVNIAGVSAGGWMAANIISSPDLIGENYSLITSATLYSPAVDQEQYFDGSNEVYNITKPGIEEYKDLTKNSYENTINPIEMVENVSSDIDITIYQGGQDDITPLTYAQEYKQLLENNGNNVVLNVYEESGHVLSGLFLGETEVQLMKAIAVVFGQEDIQQYTYAKPGYEIATTYENEILDWVTESGFIDGVYGDSSNGKFVEEVWYNIFDQNIAQDNYNYFTNGLENGTFTKNYLLHLACDTVEINNWFYTNESRLMFYYDDYVVA